MMADREKSLAALEARLADLKAARSVPAHADQEIRRLEQDARARLADLRAQLRAFAKPPAKVVA